MFWIAGYTYDAEIGEINIQCYSCWLVASVFTGSRRSSFEWIRNVLPCFCSAVLCVDLSMTSSSFLLALMPLLLCSTLGEDVYKSVWLLSSLPQLVAWNQIHCCHCSSPLQVTLQTDLELIEFFFIAVVSWLQMSISILFNRKYFYAHIFLFCEVLLVLFSIFFYCYSLQYNLANICKITKNSK